MSAAACRNWTPGLIWIYRLIWIEYRLPSESPQTPHSAGTLLFSSNLECGVRGGGGSGGVLGAGS